MRWLTQWVRRLLGRVIVWASAERDAAMHAAVREAGEAAGYLSALNIERLRTQMSAMLALDVNFHDTGKVILICRVGEKHIVQIVDIPAKMTLNEYKRAVAELKARFGVRTMHVDGLPGMGPEDFQ